MQENKDWDTYFMDIAYMVSTRSRCPRRRVGAALIQGKRLLGTGYNGAPMGVPDCAEAGCLMIEQREETEGVRKQHCIRTIHAEQNLLLFTDCHDRQDAIVYVTDEPCWICANMMANSGIREIVYWRPYPKDHDKVRDLFDQVEISLRQLLGYMAPKTSNVKIQL